MWVMERLLRFGTSTAPLFLTPLYLWDLCCLSSAAKHKEKSTLADATWFPASLCRWGASWSHFEDQGYWGVQTHPTSQISEPQKLVEFSAGSVWTWTWLGSNIVLSPATSQRLGEQRWSHGTGLPPEENIIYHFFFFFLWRYSLYSYLLYLSHSPF